MSEPEMPTLSKQDYSNPSLLSIYIFEMKNQEKILRVVRSSSLGSRRLSRLKYAKKIDIVVRNEKIASVMDGVQYKDHFLSRYAHDLVLYRKEILQILMPYILLCL